LRHGEKSKVRTLAQVIPRISPRELVELDSRSVHVGYEAHNVTLRVCTPSVTISPLLHTQIHSSIIWTVWTLSFDSIARYSYEPKTSLAPV